MPATYCLPGRPPLASPTGPALPLCLFLRAAVRISQKMEGLGCTVQGEGPGPPRNCFPPPCCSSGLAQAELTVPAQPTW